VDDEQWLDRASAQALAFVARRLQAESVGLVFAARAASDELAGLPALVVEGLREGDAHALLHSALTAPLDPRVRDRIVAEARGNPLALIELLHELTPAELAGGFGLPAGVPISSGIEDSYRRRLEALPAETRRLLLLAAADPVGDPLLVWRAAERLGIPAQAATPAAEAALLEFGARVLFRHPLVRSAAYRSASLHERQDVHRALAEVTDPGSIPTAAPGTGPTPRRAPTRTSPKSSSAPPAAPRAAGARPRRPRSSSARRRSRPNLLAVRSACSRRPGRSVTPAHSTRHWAC
jgi:hypothetical protein